MNYLIFTTFLVVFLYTVSIPISKFTFDKKELIYDKASFSKSIGSSCKGLAILIIMMSHVANGFGVRWFTPLGSLGVGVFLFFSGFGLEISCQKNGLKSFWIKRIKTAYLPYLIMQIFGYAFLYHNYHFIDVVKDVFLIKPMHPYGWYMQCLFLYYIAFYISQLISKKSKILKYVALSLSSIIIFIFLRALFKQQLFTFVLGVLSGAHKEKVSNIISKWMSFIVSFLSGSVVLAFKQFQIIRSLPEHLYCLIEAIQVMSLTIAFLSLVHIVVQKISPVIMYSMVFVGMISYELYLIHAFFVPIIVSYVKICLFFAISLSVSAIVFLCKKHISNLVRQLKSVK